MPDYLGKLDSLINNLEAAIQGPTQEDIAGILQGQMPKRGTYRILAETFSGIAARKPRPAEIHDMTPKQVEMRSQMDVARKMPVEISILAEKTCRGEVVHIVQGNVISTTRVSGAYQIQTTVEQIRKVMISAQKRFLDYVAAGDAASWNRWCADLDKGAVLQDCDLGRVSLANFDLCCADLSQSDLQDANLSGAMLAGANLADCNLDGVKVGNTDFFRARIPRRYMGLLLASGMVEVESVILV